MYEYSSVSKQHLPKTNGGAGDSSCWPSSGCPLSQKPDKRNTNKTMLCWQIRSICSRQGYFSPAWLLKGHGGVVVGQTGWAGIAQTETMLLSETYPARMKQVALATHAVRYVDQTQQVLLRNTDKTRERKWKKCEDEIRQKRWKSVITFGTVDRRYHLNPKEKQHITKPEGLFLLMTLD